MGRIFLSAPHVGEEERRMLLAALDSGWIAPLGPEVEAFERELAAVVGMPYAVALSSGTAALHLSLVLLGVERGDEVMTATLTFAATANAIAYTGATPIFVDSERRTLNMDPALLAEELDRRAAAGRLPRAVIVVDIYGQCADYDPLLAACAKYDVPVIEDAAEALGATYKGRPAGSFAPMAAFSFNGNKVITTSGGGMLVTTKRELADRARFLATQARDPAPHYEHSTIGYNYRLSALLAALGRAQLKGLSGRVARRRAIHDLYCAELGRVPGIEVVREAEMGSATHWLTVVKIDPDVFGATREEIRRHLESLDIEARPAWKPMHLQPVFAAAPRVGGGVAEELFERGLCLPSGSGLDDDDIRRVIDGVLEAPKRT
ncbi:MAG: aminotransferase class I/II-fold pyridoxal phosphate-dependent enzyme [Labilithrix sp.]|nr:aminotransferase class I/II-fold pyridoxal phosphate-dependent enzyme [Labilithrix sp.]MCW5814723.1 aminotransferase class I/II-fold pyridoxal phosphate-dependent enzyme [Labilithrix sp.]